MRRRARFRLDHDHVAGMQNVADTARPRAERAMVRRAGPAELAEQDRGGMGGALGWRLTGTRLKPADLGFGRRNIEHDPKPPA